MQTMRTTIAVLFCLAGYCYSAEWGYVAGNPNELEPKDWKNGFPKCAGKSQSPINIETRSTYLCHLPPILLGKSWGTLLKSADLSLANVGSTIKIDVKSSIPITTTKEGTIWKLAQMHLHWGRDSNTGSEHTINGKYYPAEIHFVHFNSRYATIGEAVAQPDGLLVLGFFFKVDEKAVVPSIYQKLFGALDKIKFKGQKMKLDLSGRALGDMIPPKGTDRYYSYAGSLTTPTCDESVNWNVMSEDNAIVVTEKEMMELRKLSAGKMNQKFKPQSGNFRPIQPRNNRLVKRNFRTAKTAFFDVIQTYAPMVFNYFNGVPMRFWN